jgi:tetratricopeptide (TPR) repeat protein
MGAVAAFLLALLAAVGLLRIIVFTGAGTACAAAVVAAVVCRRRAAEVLAVGWRTARRSVLALGAAARPFAAGAAVRAERAQATARAGATRGAGYALRHGRLATTTAWNATSRNAAAVAARVPTLVEAAAARAARARRPQAPPAGRRHRDALEANAEGLRLRRAGLYGEAAEQHRRALVLFRELGDRRSEALTLNNLALALDRLGDPAALDLLEEAATILGEVGDEQHEGEVIANLALAFRRRGREERSAEVLEIALGKLEPDSQAYRRVEHLRRAS